MREVKVTHARNRVIKMKYKTDLSICGAFWSMDVSMKLINWWMEEKKRIPAIEDITT